MNYQVIIENLKSDSYLITDHARKRMAERGISTTVLENALIQGEIIESYEDDEPCPSFLILSIAMDIYLHIVIGLYADHLRIITCYHPDENEWTNYRERRR